MAAVPLVPAPPPFAKLVPLPPNPFDQANNATSYEAYLWCRQSEIEAGTDAKLLMYARCLGYLLLEAPSPEARGIFSDEIIECIVQGADVNLLAEFYIKHLFRLCAFFSLAL